MCTGTNCLRTTFAQVMTALTSMSSWIRRFFPKPKSSFVRFRFAKAEPVVHGAREAQSSDQLPGQLAPLPELHRLHGIFLAVIPDVDQSQEALEDVVVEVGLEGLWIQLLDHQEALPPELVQGVGLLARGLASLLSSLSRSKSSRVTSPAPTMHLAFVKAAGSRLTFSPSGRASTDQP